MSKYGPGGDGAAEYAFGSADDYGKKPFVRKKPTVWTFLHFQAGNGMDVIIASSQDAPPREFYGMPEFGHRGGRWTEQFYNRREDSPFCVKDFNYERKSYGNYTMIAHLKNGEVVSFPHYCGGSYNRATLPDEGCDPLLEMSYDKCMGLVNSAPMQNKATPQKPQKRSTTMQNSMEILTTLQLQGGAKVVSAVYLSEQPVPSAGGTKYHFKNVIGVDLAPGDIIACETRDTFALLRVVDPDVMVTDVGCPLHDLKHVVAKMKSEEFSRIKEAENNAIRQLSLSEVTSKLDTYRKQVGDSAFNAVASIMGVDPGQRALSAQDTISGEVVDDADA